MSGLGVDVGGPRDEFSCPGFIEGVEVFLDQKIRNNRRQLQADRGCDWAATLMGGYPRTIRLGNIRGRDGGGDAAKRHGFGLKDTDVASASQSFKVSNFVELFSRSDRD